MTAATVLALGSAVALADGDDLAANSPSTRPAGLNPSDIRQAVLALDSPDPAEQANARVQLMGMPREQLSLVRACVEHRQRVSPSMAASLHEVVLQVFLAEEPYPVHPLRGFLGLRWPEGLGYDDAARLGVPVGTRLLGFPGYRVLETGDLILGLVVQPDLPLQQPPNLPTPDRGRLTEAIGNAGASHLILLEVLRQGERIRLPVRLYPGLAIDQTEISAFTDQRRARAEAYWRDTFLPVIRPGIS